MDVFLFCFYSKQYLTKEFILFYLLWVSLYTHAEDDE